MSQNSASSLFSRFEKPFRKVSEDLALQRPGHNDYEGFSLTHQQACFATFRLFFFSIVFVRYKVCVRTLEDNFPELVKRIVAGSEC